LIRGLENLLPLTSPAKVPLEELIGKTAPGATEKKVTKHLDKKVIFPTQSLLVVAASSLLFVGGCNSRVKSTGADEKSTTSGGASQTIDMNCMGDRLDNPPEAFHYSYKTTGSQNDVAKEADVTPQTMDITIRDKSGSHTYHGERSKESSWNGAVLDLSGSGLTTMIARLGFIKDTSALLRAGAEQTNGYGTTKYFIDTAGASASDTKRFATLFGSGSYDKGAMWVSAEGCPVKVVLDEATQQADGSVTKVHYELNFIKK